MKHRKKRVLGSILLFFIVAIFVLWNREDLIRLFGLMSSGDKQELVAVMKASPIAPLLSIVLMVLQSVIAPIPSFLIAGANGVIFGIIGGVVISWIGAMCGAAVTFYLSRFLGEPFVRRFEKSSALMQKVEEISKKHGAKVILIGRLLPFVSFDLLSYAAGLSTIKASKFFLATGVGMLPGTILYVVVGNQIGTYEQYSTYLTIAVVIMIVFWLLFQVWKKIKINTK